MNTQKSILEIAIETGFGTSSYFGKIFRQYHHLTPTPIPQAQPPTDRTRQKGLVIALHGALTEVVVP